MAAPRFGFGIAIILSLSQLDWKERLESSERMVSVLQERLEATRSQLYDQDKLVSQLRSDLQVDAEELTYWKEQRGQDMEKLEQVSVGEKWSLTRCKHMYMLVST